MKTMNFDFLRKIAREEDSSPRVCSTISLGDEMSPIGALVWNARVHFRLTRNAFARKSDIDVEELTSLEENHRHTPDTRTIYNISKFLRIENTILAEIAGFIKVRDPQYEEKLYGFAASSRKIRDCSDEQTEIFEQYLAVLHERGSQRE